MARSKALNRKENVKGIPKVSKLERLNVNDLVNELKKIHDYLSAEDQDDVDRSELIDLSKELAKDSLVKHRDGAIRVLVSCGIANILRLFAPDAPYSVEELMLFIQQLKMVGNPDEPFYNYHYFLLESLSTVKSIVLIFDLPEGTEMVGEIVKVAFDLIHPTLHKNVRLYLVELVQTLIDESQVVPGEVVDEIIQRVGKEGDYGRKLAEDLIRICGDKLQPYLGQHFNNLLGQIARGNDSESVLARLGREAHDFAVRVAVISIPASSSILIQLEEELRVELVEIRVLAIESLGRIFKSVDDGISKAWNCWLGRRHDKATKCRIAWCRSALSIISTNPGSILVDFIIERLQDQDERVRLALIQEIKKSIPFSPQLADAIAERCLDRKDDVKTAALGLSSDWLIGGIKNSLDIEEFHNNYKSFFNNLFHLIYTEGRQNSLLYIFYLESSILTRLQLEINTPERVLWVYLGLDDQSLEAFRMILRIKSRFTKGLEGLIRMIKKIESLKSSGDSNELSVVKARYIQVCQYLSENFPNNNDAHRAFISLIELPSKEPSLFEVLQVYPSKNNFKFIVSHPLVTKDPILQMALPMGCMVSINSKLIGDLASSAKGSNDPIHRLFQEYTNNFPQLFSDRSVELVKLAVSTNGASEHLIPLAHYLATYPLTLEQEFIRLLEDIVKGAVVSSDLKRIKASALILFYLDREGLGELVDDLILQLGQSENIEGVIASLVGLINLMKVEVNAVNYLVPHFEVIFDLITTRFISAENIANLSKYRTKKHETTRGRGNEGNILDEWCGMNSIGREGVVVVLGIRFLGMLGSGLVRQYGRNGGGSVELSVVSSIKSMIVGFFLEMLDKNEIFERINIDPMMQKIKYRLLKGLVLCLPDSSVKVFAESLTILLLSVQDSSHMIRYKMTGLIGKMLLMRRLSDPFIPILFIAGAHEPSSVLKQAIKLRLEDLIKMEGGLHDNKGWRMEDMMSVLGVYLAVHPDYQDLDKDWETMQLAKGYFNFYCEVVLKSGNCGYLYESVSRLKLYKMTIENIDERGNVRLYVAAELAQQVVKERCANHHWPIESNCKLVPTTQLLSDVLIELDEGRAARNIHTNYINQIKLDSSKRRLENIKSSPKQEDLEFNAVKMSEQEKTNNSRKSDRLRGKRDIGSSL